MRKSILALGMGIAFGSLLLHSAALAQPGTDDGEGDAASGAQAVVAPSDPTAARVQELENRETQRQAALDAALQRIEQLEQGAQAAQQAATERAAQEAEEEAARAAAAEEAEEQSGPTVRPLASMLTRFEHREGYTALGRPGTGCVSGDNDCIRYRARVGMQISDLRVSDEVIASVRFLPQVTGNWAMGSPATSGGVNHPNVGLYEGYLRLAIDSMVKLDVGRFLMAYGEHLAIGTLGWHPAARSFDGARMRIQPDSDGIWVDAFWTMLNEGGTDSFGDADRSFYGVYAGLGPALLDGMDLDLYALALQQNATAGTDWSLRVTIGGRFRYRVEIVDMRVETGLQVGRDSSSAGITAGHVDGEVGLNLADNRFRLGLEGQFASGNNATTSDNEAYNQLFPTAHAFLGLMDITGGRSNVASGVLHLMARPIPQLAFKLDVHVFARPEVGAGQDNLFGGEGDLNVIWTPGAGFRVRGLYGLFIPNEGFFGPGADPAHYLELELAYTLN